MSEFKKIDTIANEMAAMDSMLVAFSGGVDSALVAAIAKIALGEKAVAATAVSETLPERELEESKTLATEIGIAHRLVSFSELDDPEFVKNDTNRCFFCQSMRFDQLRLLADKLDFKIVASGTNIDDTNEHRPGLIAMEERGVYQPLLRHQVPKAQVRRFAKHLGVSVWDKPSKACLSSRIPTGIAVTEARLRRVELGEEILHEFGFVQFRVRDHNGLARVEVSPDTFEKLFVPATMTTLTERLKDVGYDRVAFDVNGYRPAGLIA